MTNRLIRFFLLLMTILNGSICWADFRNPEITPELKEELREFFLWLSSPDAHKYDITIKQFPPRNPNDCEGDITAFNDTLQKIYAKPFLPLLFAFGEEEKTAVLEVWQNLSQNTRRSLVLEATRLPTHAGDKLTIAATLMGSLIKSFITDDDLTSAFLTVATNHHLADWNGTMARFIYENEELEHAVAVIASVTKHDPQRSMKIFNSLEPEIRKAFQINLNSDDPKTHSEPFDLVQGGIVRISYFNIYKTVSRIALTKIVHRSLYRLWSLTPENDPRGVEISDLILFQPVGRESDSVTALLCSGELKVRGLNTTIVDVSGRLYAIETIQNEAIYSEGKKAPIRVTCANEEYTLKSTPVAAEPLTMPDPYDVEALTEDRALSVLVNFSLTEETSPALIGATIAYMSVNGYRLTGMKRNQETLPVFKKAFVEADILMPAAHLIDINSFNLGTAKGNVLRFRKVFRHKSGRRIPVEVTALFPGVKGASRTFGATLSINELAQLLSERRERLSHSLFVLTLSCDSASAVVSWTNAYRKSLVLDIAAGKIDSVTEAQDLIYAIAPKGGFPTNSPSELIFDFIPALMTLDMLAKGESPNDVVKKLKEPIRPDRFTNMVAVIEKWFGVKSSKDKAINLDPVFNLEKPHLLDSSGFIVELVKETHSEE